MQYMSVPNSVLYSLYEAEMSGDLRLVELSPRNACNLLWFLIDEGNSVKTKYKGLQ